MARRAIVIVLDGCGAGATPDAAEFGDPHGPSTLANVVAQSGPLHAPRLASMGFLASAGLAPGDPARYGRLRPISRGKDSVTGHWEMMGIVTDVPFPTYPRGFPTEVVQEFEARIGRQTLGNRAASGTQILEDLGEEHMQSGFPILYTSADSVFQIAAHEEVVPVSALYEMCVVARQMLVPPHNVLRVIARPFEGDPRRGWKRTDRRKDYPAAPPSNLVDRIGDIYGIGVVPELFAERGFRPVRRTQSNPEHAKMLQEALDTDARFIFANFEDFDMLYGHRNDPAGFARCLEEFDVILSNLRNRLGPDDLLILTADHGNDPTDLSTDHTREYSPVAIHGAMPGNLGDREGLHAIGATVADWLGVTGAVGTSLL